MRRPKVAPWVKSALVSVHLHIARRPPISDLRCFLAKLRPVECDIDLIRLGGNGDGGYLIPNDLEGIDYCFSPGVSTVASFESDLADRGIRSYLTDFSVEAPPIARPEFTFDKKFLGAYDGDNVMTLASWKDRYQKAYSGDLLLQMDIEGSEYEVILNTPDSLLDQFRIIVIEFHDLHRLFDPFGFNVISTCFYKVLRSFHVLHIHPNNCRGAVTCQGIAIPPVMEFTFINKRRVSHTRPQVQFPHKLDADNTQAKPIVLPACWYVEPS
jgi:hypothetical protein